MEMTSIKTIAVFMIIFGCFAVLYPKIFHPMLMQFVGYGSNERTTEDIINNKMSPHMKKPAGKTIPAGDDIARHMRAGPHPGMRAAAEMKKQAAPQGTGTGKGMMAIVLPMYAVGIVLYLIYTMTKVFGSKGSPNEKTDFLNSHFSDVHYDPDKQKFTSTMHQEPTVKKDGEENISRRFKKGRRDLERLLLKADKNNISQGEMHELKRRLLETESQMTRILGAMESVQQHTQQVIDEASREEGDGEEEDQGEWIEEDEEGTMEDGEEMDHIEVESCPKKRSSDVSPDMDSYEFVKGQSTEVSPDGSTQQSPSIEDLGADLPSGSPQEQTLSDSENISTEISNDSDGAGDIPFNNSRCREDDESIEEPVEDVLMKDLEDDTKSSSDEDHPDLRKRLPRDEVHS